MEKIFGRALKLCAEVYEKHRAAKGDSWQTCEYDFLLKKFFEEFHEFAQIPGNNPAYLPRTPNFPLIQGESKQFSDDLYFAQLYSVEELIDIVNVALMLIERILTFRKMS